jgi:uncharacterized protein (UPF0305 family)
MDTQDLLETLKDDARTIARSYPSELRRLRATAGTGVDPASAVAAYDCQAFDELLALDRSPRDGVVEAADLADFRERIDRYMSAHVPGNEGFKDYIGTISVYLVFIARRPLHPPGMKFSGGKEIVLAGGIWRCPGKKKYIGDPESLCKYCVCKGY